ncbi:phenylacetate-coenzyme A ligase PaaK-like adenylate-forming protein [Micromonospora violae]|uniref:Phenylacetate-coenzyme A ligase PaaK-like adenylate-forming protein n=1 Tax=Micromonospora violae TaxID=1278207 RepID=A0A4Q7UBD9_9ACTN|nr:phenylacetate--CoA ligase family protein [Micromonospora violae]RZT77488.1 phenylacetate-coenzyme A ligase PaaK-like adenylate-forming protein [Micromonospora violae]
MRALMERGWLFAERRRRLERKIALYNEPLSRAEIERIQVERFNRIWAYCLTQVPFYRSWRKEHGLPSGISRPSDLHYFPVLDKELLISRSAEVFAQASPKQVYSTGGSTGQPTRFPRGRSESTDRWANNYLGRAWRGIRPFEPQVLLWGHSHLFGDGMASRVARLKRDVADRLVNITRLNAYDLSDPALRGHYEEIRSRQPVMLVGYTSAIFKVARYIERNGLDLGDMSRLRAVILTAETASDADIALIERVFGASAVIEYGAAETGLMAMSRAQARPIQVIWDSYICLVDQDGSLAVTTLDDRLFPLVNYAIGDQIEPTDVVDGNVLKIHSILGRQQEIVQVGSASGILDLSPILPVHILKTLPGIVGVQFRQERPDALHINVQADHELDLEAVHLYFVRELRKDHPDLSADSITFHQVADQTRTRAGKHALFVS